MADFNPLNFIANHAGMNLADAIKAAYEQGKRDAQPERKMGKWIEYIPEHGKCPFCGNHVDLMGGKENNYCGECGAHLR